MILLISERSMHAVLTLAQTSRSKNTSKAYNRVEKEWRNWCEQMRYDDDDLVIINYIYQQAHEGSVEVVVASIEVKRAGGKHTLDALSNKIRKGACFLGQADDFNAPMGHPRPSQQVVKSQADKHRKDVSYEVGDQVVFIKQEYKHRQAVKQTRR
ncbi:MAG: hypothetical protein Q9191_000765 [Dirinaria sp. TL-2023a]